MKTIPLEFGKFYHIYNRGINGCNLFQENENYEYFLHLYDKYISSVADTYAWVLMRNHFHFLVKIKKEGDIPFMGIQTPEGLKDTSGTGTNLSEVNGIQNLQGFTNLEGLNHPKNRNRVNQQFANLFNAYTKAINKRYHRTGSLFEHPFRRLKSNQTII